MDDKKFAQLNLFHPRLDPTTTIRILTAVADTWGTDLFPAYHYDEDRRGPRQVPITPGEISNLIKGWNPRHLSEIELFRDDEGYETKISLGDLSGDSPCNSANIEISQCLCRTTPRLLDSLSTLAESLLNVAVPLKVHICTQEDQLSWWPKGTSRVLATAQRARVYWRNYWSPQWIAWLGGDAQVTSAPWFAMERIAGGWLRLDTAPTAFEWDDPTHLARRTAITEQLALSRLEDRIAAAIRSHRRQTWPNFVVGHDSIG